MNVSLRMRYRFLIILILMTSFSRAFSQNEEESVIFDELIVNDTLTALAEPVGGYNALMRYIETTINEGDTVHNKFSLHLYNVGFKVNRLGIVDSTYIRVNHSACPLHKKIASIIRQTAWVAAKEHGRPIDSYIQLSGTLYFSKRILKKNRCW